MDTMFNQRCVDAKPSFVQQCLPKDQNILPLNSKISGIPLNDPRPELDFTSNVYCQVEIEAPSKFHNDAQFVPQDQTLKNVDELEPVPEINDCSLSTKYAPNTLKTFMKTNIYSQLTLTYGNEDSEDDELQEELIQYY